jgi:hypothetical protein
MNLTGEEAKALVDEARARAGILKQLTDKQLGHLLHQAIKETGVTLGGIEDRIGESGSMPGDVATILLHYGAVVAVLEDLPEGDERRQLIAAGRATGRLVAKKYGEKIEEELKEKKGDN